MSQAPNPSLERTSFPAAQLNVGPTWVEWTQARFVIGVLREFDVALLAP